jgi:hypothetical protein
VTRRVRSFSAARRATVQICDREGSHRGQGLLLDIEGEGAVVLTCHHVIAQLPPEGIYVRVSGEDESLGELQQVSYDERRSHPTTDAVVLRLSKVQRSERPLLHQLDPSEYSGSLHATVITYLPPGSFNATVTASAHIDMPVLTPDARLPSGSRYVIPQTFRLANPTDARQGISGGVAFCNGGVLGLVQSARRETDTQQAEVYLLPLGLWAEGWEALNSLIEPFAGAHADPYSYALQDYLRALDIFSNDAPYVALDMLLSGTKRAPHEVYIPFRAVPAKPRREDADGREGEEGQGGREINRKDDAENGVGLPAERAYGEIAPPALVTLADMLREATSSVRCPHVLLQGMAGIGKSMALRRITDHAWSRPHLLGLNRSFLPMVIRLHLLADTPSAPLEEWLLGGLSRAGDLALERTLPSGFFHEWTSRENVRWLLLLDGLDEVAAERRAGILRWIKSLLQKLEGQHHVVLTSRPTGDEQYQELSSLFAVYDVLPFDDGQLQDFATRWFPAAAEDFRAKVQRIIADSLFRERLAATPLLLTIAAAIYHKEGDLPESGQAELYAKFIDILFAEARHRGLHDELGEDVSDVAHAGLEELALAMTERPAENTLAALTQSGAEFLRGEFGWQQAKAEARAKRFVEVMGRRAGVLYRTGESFQWMHPTFREHLAAQALARRLRGAGNDYEAVIGERLRDDAWYEVLRNLSLLHHDPQSLVGWLCREAGDHFAAGEALLAYDCWRDSSPHVREALKADITGALACGLGDDQSGLAKRNQLLQHLTQLGGDATGQLLALLDEYNGLQQRLLPEWADERQHPDIHSEPGRSIYRGYRLRHSIIKVLGDVGDRRAVEPLMALLNERDRTDCFRWDITRAVRRALRCIGSAAVDPLLVRIGDTALATQTRIDCLTALGEIGIRSDAVTPALDACLNEGLRGNAELLAPALWVATILRDRAHTESAISALTSDDKYVIERAATYLARMPDPPAFTDLSRAFTKWLSVEGDYFILDWTLRSLAVALIATGKSKAKRIIFNFVKSSIENRGRLPPDDAVQVGDEVRLPALPQLLLNELIDQLSLPEPDRIVDKLVERLSVMWRPEQKRKLVALTHKSEGYATGSGGFADRLVSLCIEPRRPDGEQHFLRDYLDRSQILRTTAKCQVPDFINQVGRFFPDAEHWFVSELSDALWIAGDTSAEELLLAVLSRAVRPSMQADRPTPEEYDVLRALGTCCTERGAEAVISYVRENPDLSIYLPEEVLCTLVRRAMLDVGTLARMSEDITGTHEYVRRACVLAIGYLDAPRFADVFLRVVASESDEQTRAYAAAFLGWAKTDRSRVVNALRTLLTTTTQSFLATRASQALVRLGERESLQIIERAAERLSSAGAASGLLRAAARFRALSTLKLLENAPAKVRAHHHLGAEANITAAFGEFYQMDTGARSFVDAQLEHPRIGFDSGKQSIAAGVLATHNPNWLLQRATRLYDEGRLDASTCLTLIKYAPRLSRSKRVDKTWLVEIMKRLLCDDDLSIREGAGEALQFVAPSLRPRAYDELRVAGNEWARACAVYSLGFWDSDEKVIESARFDASPVVRRLASTAAAMRRKRPALRQLARTFRTARGTARVSAYFSILEQGTNSLIDMLYRDIKEDDLGRIHLRELDAAVERRVNDERKKRLGKEQDEICEEVRHVNFA